MVSLDDVSSRHSIVDMLSGERNSAPTFLADLEFAQLQRLIRPACRLACASTGQGGFAVAAFLCVVVADESAGEPTLSRTVLTEGYVAAIAAKRRGVHGF